MEELLLLLLLILLLLLLPPPPPPPLPPQLLLIEIPVFGDVTLENEVLRSFEPAEFTHPTTRRHIPESLNQFHHSKNPDIFLIIDFPTPSVYAGQFGIF